MIKHIRILILFLGLGIAAPAFVPVPAQAQCAMCKLNAENGLKSKQHKTGLGINEGILMLLAMPYTAVMVIGVLWYRNSKYNTKRRVVREEN